MNESMEKNIMNQSLSQERRHERYEKLKSVLFEVSERLNESFKAEMGGGKVGDLLDKECRINSKSFSQGRRQGPYTEDEIKFDLARMEDKKNKEFGIDFENENIIEHYKAQGAETKEEILEKFWEEKGQANWHLLEMATPVLFYKFLPKNFVAVKTSVYDDSENGVDNLIVDKDTGEVVCAVDDFSALLGSERDESKKDKVLNKTRRGGAKVKYGISYEAGKLVKKSMRNLPVVNLRLSSNSLKGLLREMNFNLDHEPSQKEREVVTGIIEDFIQQTDVLLGSEIGDEMKKRIEKFQKVLKNWSENLTNTSLKN